MYIADLGHKDGISVCPDCDDSLFFFFLSKMCKMENKRIPDVTFLDSVGFHVM